MSLVCFVLLALLVANLRRSRTGRRLIAVRTNERAAASLGISVFGVKLYAFAVSAGLAAVAGILVGFRGQVITYTEFNVFASINSLGHAVIGGLGFVLGAVFAAPNAIGGLGTRVIEDWIGLGGPVGPHPRLPPPVRDPHRPPERHRRRGHRTAARLWEKLHLVARRAERAPLPPAEVEPVPAATLSIDGPDRPLRLGGGGRGRVDGGPTRARSSGLIGPNGAGQDHAHRRRDRLRPGRRGDRSRSTIAHRRR